MPSSSCRKSKTSYNHGCRCADCRTAYRIWWRARQGPKVCKGCGVEMPRGVSGQGYCKPECSPSRGGKPSSCPVCKSAFRAKRRGSAGWTVHCSQRCAQDARVHRDPGDHRATRWEREKAAPGLNSTGRRRLLAKWLKQRRSCYFCPDLASTVDHLVPLLRGGTNFEGNLVPACRPCNSRKAWRLVVEFRTGLLVPAWRPASFTPTARRVTVPVQLELKFPRLAATHGSASYYQRGCRCEACWGWYCKSYAAKKRVGPQRARKASRSELLHRLGISIGEARSAGHPGRSGGAGVSSIDRLGTVADGFASNGEGAARDLGLVARGDPRGG